MATPTIASVSPTSGPAGGRHLVTITGTNFRLPPTPPVGLLNGAEPKTVRVKFGAETATRAFVISATSIHVFVPPYRGDPDAATHGAVAVEVTNLDDLGNSIAGETATSAAAYTYVRTNLRAPAAEPLIVRTVAEVVFAFRRQVIRNTVFTTSTDYSESGATVAMSSVPLIAISGPRITKDPIRNSVEREVFREVATGSTRDLYYPMHTYTLEFDLVGLSDNNEELFTLSQATLEFFRRTPAIEVEVDVGDASKGRHQFELELVEPIAISLNPSSPSNARSFTAGFELYDLPVELPEVVSREIMVQQLERQLQSLGSSALAETILTTL